MNPIGRGVLDTRLRGYDVSECGNRVPPYGLPPTNQKTARRPDGSARSKSGYDT